MVKLSIILALAMSPVFTVGVQAQESAAGLPGHPSVRGAESSSPHTCL